MSSVNPHVCCLGCLNGSNLVEDYVESLVAYTYLLCSLVQAD